MPSTASIEDQASLTVYRPLSPENAHRLIVLVAGFTANTGLEFYSYIRWLRRIAKVIVVNHPERGFSLESESQQLMPYIFADNVTEVYFIGLSLGARLATTTLDNLKGTEGWGRIKGVIPICGLNWRKDLKTLSPRLWPFMVWPLTSPWFIRKENAKSDHKHPGPPREVTYYQRHHADAIEYGINFPPRGRRAQIRAISELEPLKPSAYRGIPMCYLGTFQDQVLHAGRASEGWISAFSPGYAISWVPGVRHCSLNEHPFTWAQAIATAFQGWGVPLSASTFNSLVNKRG